MGIEKKVFRSHKMLFYYVYIPLSFLFGITSTGLEIEHPAYEYLMLFLFSLPASYWILMPLSFQKPYTIHSLWHFLLIGFSLAMGMKLSGYNDFLIDLSITYAVVAFFLIILIGSVLLFVFRTVKKVKDPSKLLVNSAGKWFLVFALCSIFFATILNFFVVKGTTMFNPSISEVKFNLNIVLNRFQNSCFNNSTLSDQNWCDHVKKAFVEIDGEYSDELKSPLDEIGPCSYALNENLLGLNASEIPDNVVILYDARPGWNQIGNSDLICVRSYNGAKGVFVCYWYGPQFIPQKDIHKLKWK